MIGIGINENIYIERAEFAEGRESLIISFKEKAEKELSMFEQLKSKEHIETASGRDIRLFAPQPNADDAKTEEKKIDLAFTDINNTKGQLIHILQGYMVKADADLGDMYAGIGMTEENFKQKLLNKDVLKLIFGNMVSGFLDKIKPWLNQKDPLFRLLLIRQSADKHYPALRKRFLDDSPIWEPMVIPKEQSKVAFTPYEIREKLDTDAVVDKNDADKKTSAPSKSAEEIFKQQGASKITF